ncbi:MAG: DMT family transporter [Rhodospirillales bacterium]|nr:DMT family transporter [Rhodospirillales bacterium]
MPATFVVLWSTGFVGAKFGLPYAEPFTFLLIRFFCAAAILGVAAVVVGAPWPRDPAQIGRIAAAGLMIHGIYLGGVFSSIAAGVPAGIAALIVGLQPLLTAVAAPAYLGERVSRRQWLGFGLGFVGVLLVVANKLSLRPADIAGAGWAVAALAGMTAGTLYQKRHGAGMHICTGSAIQYATVGLAYVPIALFTETMRVEWTGAFVFALGWLILVLSIGAISLLYLLIRRGAAARVASLFYLTPAVTAALAWMLFGETLGPPAIAGMAVAAVGVALVTRA